ncbi:Pyridoxal-5'-phosphate-dependent enzyme family protein [Klebsormidium nitens]|uniref:cysteine synthase n=1 Tax=Klebsormidium nitens TaxID=105231 RepID=A0A1Y1I8C1_KLENI|nr:Pyridoxal-5'-phosphate-dependent enzyme family protein [Klebsormidium nitens]|eukprot:GAQ84936.1 Pyridoxal-5'-phosphate-dependent enzyme family protein [Klebsormidium nitens]
MLSSSDAVLTAAVVAAGVIAVVATWNAVRIWELEDGNQEAETSKKPATPFSGAQRKIDEKVRDKFGKDHESPEFWRWLLGQLTMGAVDTSHAEHQEAKQGAAAGVKFASSQAEQGLLAAIGNTPLIRINSLSEATGCEILGKCEFLNPGGSVKDRVAVKIIQEGLTSGQLRPGGLVCEGSAGSTGVSLALVARAFGCRCFVALPDDAAVEKSQMLEALGAEVARVRPVSITHPGHFVNVARRRALEAGGQGRDVQKVQGEAVETIGVKVGEFAPLGMGTVPDLKVEPAETASGKRGAQGERPKESLSVSGCETTVKFSKGKQAATAGALRTSAYSSHREGSLGNAQAMGNGKARGQPKLRRKREEARQATAATEGLTPKQLRKLIKREAAAGREMVVSRVRRGDDVAQASLAEEVGPDEGEGGVGDSWFDDLLGMEEEAGNSVPNGQGAGDSNRERTGKSEAGAAQESTEAMPNGHANGSQEASAGRMANGKEARTGERWDADLEAADDLMTAARRRIDGGAEARSEPETAADGRFKSKTSGSGQEKATLRTPNDADVSCSPEVRDCGRWALADDVNNGSADQKFVEGTATGADASYSRAIATAVSAADDLSSACPEDVADSPPRPYVSGSDAPSEGGPSSPYTPSEACRAGKEAERLPQGESYTEKSQHSAPSVADVSPKGDHAREGLRSSNEREGSEVEGLAGGGFSADQSAKSQIFKADVSKEGAPAHESARSDSEGLAGGGFFADQFENLANFRAHNEGTGPEIWAQTGGHVDAFVAGAGTGGTLAGVSCFLKDQNPGVKCFLVDPPGSGLFYKVTRGVMYAPQEAEGKRLRNPFDTITEGIGINRMTRNFEKARLDGAFRASDQEAVDMARHLLLHDGLFLGSSSAVNCIGAVRAARALGPGHTIVTILCDGGQRHLSKFHNAAYLATHGLTPSERGALPLT